MAKMTRAQQDEEYQTLMYGRKHVCPDCGTRFRSFSEVGQTLKCETCQNLLKGDEVEILAGRLTGRIGTVVRVFNDEYEVFVYEVFVQARPDDYCNFPLFFVRDDIKLAGRKF